MVQYQGDMTAKILVTSETIASGSEAVFVINSEQNVGRVEKPIIIVKIGTDAVLTGSVLVEFTGRLNDFPILAAVTGSAAITVEEANNHNWGVAVIENFDYSIIKVTKVTNNLSAEIPDITIMVSGVMN